MAKIWIVEDDMNLANLTKTVLTIKGYEVEVFYEARKAIEEAKKKRPDLILMDIAMPGMDGADAVRELRKDFSLGYVPVIFLTGLISNKDENHEKTEILIDGMKYKSLGKPYEIDHLLKMVEEVVGS